MLCRLDDICPGVADRKQESCDQQLVVPVGVFGVLQRYLGCSACCSYVSVMGSANGRHQTPQAVDGIEAEWVTKTAEST